MRGVTNYIITQYFPFVISTHTPHARRDAMHFYMFIKLTKFQLTRLMRGVTIGIFQIKRGCQFQLTRLMRGVTITIINFIG